MNGGPKENANPTVLDVKSRPSKSRNASEIWSSFNRITAGNGEADDQNWYDLNHNRSMVKALQDTSDATDGRAVTLLRNSGLILPQTGTSQKSNFHFPIQLAAFAPNVVISSNQDDAIKQQYRDTIDEDELFDIIRNIQDPEHPLTLEQLGVVSRQQVEVNEVPYINGYSTVDVRFTPTIPHCSMATLIGLSIRVKLLRSLPSNDRFKVTVRIEPGTHNSEMAVNKQLADKERVCAALENKHLLGLVNKCIVSGMTLPN